MLITERQLKIPTPSPESLFPSISEEITRQLGPDETPIRFVVTESDEKEYTCEVGVLSESASRASKIKSIFEFQKRPYENVNEFNVALLIPTGVGCELGGHSGDGGAVARLFASLADNLITHPNVVNAADINELPDNGLYVEGSLIAQLLMGTVGLRKVRANRVMLIVDEHTEPFFHDLSINSASAARASLGLDCPLVVKLENPAILRSLSSPSGRAVGRIEFFERLCDVIESHKNEFDAVALSTLINIPTHFHSDYFGPDSEDMVNPWGGVEAMLTHAISSIYDIPSAHAPMMNSSEIMNLDVGIVDPRKAAEAVSTTYLHCVLKGLHSAPHPVAGQHAGNSNILDASDVSCLVLPDGCLGLPVIAALEQGIPVIAVRDRHCRMKNSFSDLPFENGQLYFAENYHEAAGIALSLKAGISVCSLKRPLSSTKVICSEVTEAQKNYQ